MAKEEARKMLRERQQRLRQAEILLEMNENGVRELREGIERLEAIINKKDGWKDKLVQPNKGEEFYYLRDHYEDGLGIGYYYRNTQAKPEHAFRTQAQAELVKDKMLLMQEMHAFAHVKNEGWEADWESRYEEKYGVVHEKYGVFKARCRIAYNSFVFGVSVKSQEIAREMFKEFGERIEEIYNKQY